MTEELLIREFNADLRNCFNFSNHKDKIFRRLVIKASKFPVYMDMEYTSPMKNKWLIIYTANKKSQVMDMSLTTFVLTFDTPIGRHAVMLSLYKGMAMYLYYPPHFFSRYAERMKINKHGTELMKHYFRYNSGYMYSHNENGIYGATTEGFAFGQETILSNILFKTFVPLEMLKGEQVEEYYEKNNIRAEMHDRVIDEDMKKYKRLPNK